MTQACRLLPRTFPKGEDGYVFARFDALQSSILELTWSAVARFEKDADGKETVRYQTDRKMLVIDKQSRANQITFATPRMSPSTARRPTHRSSPRSGQRNPVAP